MPDGGGSPRRGVSASGRSTSRSREAGSRPACERVRALVIGAELCSVHPRLFQVIADDLLLFRDGVAGDALQPVGETFVELRASSFRDRLVGRVADQEMAESEGILADQRRAFGTDQLLPHERQEIRPDVSAVISGHEIHDGADEELLPDDGCGLEHVALLEGEPIHAGGKQRLDRGRDDDLVHDSCLDRQDPVLREEAIVDEHPEDLLEEQRVAFGGPRDPFDDLGREIGRHSESRQERPCLFVGERLE